MKASDYIVSFISERGVDTVFGYIGGMITHLVDSLARCENVRYIQTYHEQTAAIAAEGYAIENGKFGVAISTSGPGATNMMTGIADAYFDSIPVLYITGQVNSYEYKYDKPIRQQGFQETDIVSIVKPITKYAAFVDDAKKIRYELEKAIHIATTGRKGPVLLDIAMNVQRTDINPEDLLGYTDNSNPIEDKYDLTEIVDLFSKSKRPMVLLGAGCIGNEIQKHLENFIFNHKVPVVTSLMGRGAIDETYQYYIGMVGSYGNRCANIAISQADLLIVLGSRLDTRQTGAKIDTFLTNGHIVHVDIDANELKYHRIHGQKNINMDVLSFIQAINGYSYTLSPINKWHEYILDIKSKYNQEQEIERFVDNKSPYKFIQFLNTLTMEGDVITTDVGQNQMWAAQTIQMKKNMKFLTSGGLAPMGYSMPAAIGMSFADSNRTIYALCGDGGFHMSVQSLMVIAQYHLPIKVIVLNNSTLGMITQFQHLYFDNLMAGTTAEGGYLVPNLKAMAESYGLKYGCISITTTDEDAKEIIKESELIEYKIDGLTTVCPKLEYNKPIENPIPLLRDEELKDIIFKV